MRCAQCQAVREGNCCTACTGGVVAPCAAPLPLPRAQRTPWKTMDGRQPPWQRPAADDDESRKAVLHVYNSLTSSKVPFTPIRPGHVSWYACGPTVYDSAHMGHARAYVTFDIIRRILQDYFNYNIFYVMNITDIDDKIILRARRNHLFDEYVADPYRSLDVVRHDADKAFATAIESLSNSILRLQCMAGKADSKRREDELIGKCDEQKKKLENLKAQEASFRSASDRDAVLVAARDVLSEWLDGLKGGSVTDHRIFRDHAARYEAEFLKDMAELNVREPDALTRVSEYVGQIEQFVATLVERGFAYETNGSVYFDVEKFSSSPGCHYAKLCPWSVGNEALLEEGEGALSAGADVKRHRNDFALWKRSKSGEPAWHSRWGPGRPGWHIECSVMASDLLGEHFDIHSGGEDLKFPHHDNEIAQSEARFGCPQWVNYWMHAGHLSIEGLKMSKSLKNFITIRDALNRYTPRQIRLLFLLQAWDKPMNFSDQSLEEAIAKERRLNEFFKSASVVVRSGIVQNQVWDKQCDRALHDQLLACQNDVHAALLDDFDYSIAMSHLFNLLGDVNKYMSGPSPKALLVKKVAAYFMRMLTVFGVIPDAEPGFNAGERTDSMVPPILDAITAFRSTVRQAARSKAPPSVILNACDLLRDETLPDLGVRLEDVNEATVWKLDDPEVMRKEREERTRQLRADQLKKMELKLSMKKKELERLQRDLVDPSAMFSACDPPKYSQFDADGVPTHNLDGSELAPKPRSKLVQKMTKAKADYEKAKAGAGKAQALQQEIADLSAQVESFAM